MAVSAATIVFSNASRDLWTSVSAVVCVAARVAGSTLETIAVARPVRVSLSPSMELQNSTKGRLRNSVTVTSRTRDGLRRPCGSSRRRRRSARRYPVERSFYWCSRSGALGWRTRVCRVGRVAADWLDPGSGKAGKWGESLPCWDRRRHRRLEAWQPPQRVRGGPRDGRWAGAGWRKHHRVSRDRAIVGCHAPAGLFAWRG